MAVPGCPDPGRSSRDVRIPGGLPERVRAKAREQLRSPCRGARAAQLGEIGLQTKVKHGPLDHVRLFCMVIWPGRVMLLLLRDYATYDYAK